jgi:hypothetical protein
MRLVSYAFLAAVLAVVCVGYVRYVWVLALAPSFLPFEEGIEEAVGATNGNVSQNLHIQSYAVAVVDRLGLPRYVGGEDVWPTHMLFFTMVWSTFLLVAFMDLSLEHRSRPAERNPDLSLGYLN